MIGGQRAEPKIKPELASYELVGPLGEMDAAGFPEGWVGNEDVVRDYFVRGNLRNVSQGGPYAWTVEPSDKPDDPRKWKGMSGSAVCRLGPDDKLYLFGASRCSFVTMRRIYGARAARVRELRGWN